MDESRTHTAQTARTGSSRDQSAAGRSDGDQDEPLRGGEVTSMCESDFVSIRAEMRAYLEHYLRSIRLQQTEDINRVTYLAQGFPYCVNFLEANPGSPKI